MAGGPRNRNHDQSFFHPDGHAWPQWKAEAMSDDERTTVTREPETVVARRSSSAGWWVAALVAIVAIFGVMFMLTRNGPTQEDLQAARDQGVVEANMASATTGAQQAAASAAQAAQAAAARTAQAADATADAARDVTSTDPEPRN